MMRKFFAASAAMVSLLMCTSQGFCQATLNTCTGSLTGAHNSQYHVTTSITCGTNQSIIDCQVFVLPVNGGICWSSDLTLGCPDCKPVPIEFTSDPLPGTDCTGMQYKIFVKVCLANFEVCPVEYQMIWEQYDPPIRITDTNVPAATCSISTGQGWTIVSGTPNYLRLKQMLLSPDSCWIVPTTVAGIPFFNYSGTTQPSHWPGSNVSETVSSDYVGPVNFDDGSGVSGNGAVYIATFNLGGTIFQVVSSKL
jgi:hypothetical protein